MGWIEKSESTPFDNMPIEGLHFLDGDQVARVVQRDWVKGWKLPLIVFPSEVECDVSPTGNPATIATVHLFGEMDLPLGDTRDRAFEQADDIAEQCGYMARKVDENQLEVWGHDLDEHLIVVYDNAQQRMVDVVQVKDPPERPLRRVGDLLDEKSKASLPPLYSNEEQGMDAKAQIKFFTPDSNWTWYASEFDGKDTFFGLVSGHEVELGYFTLSELEAALGPMGLAIERDRFFTSKTLRELKQLHEQAQSGPSWEPPIDD